MSSTLTVKGRLFSGSKRQNGKRCQVFNNQKSGNGTQVTKLLKKIKKMVERNRGQHYEIDRTILQEVEEKK